MFNKIQSETYPIHAHAKSPQGTNCIRFNEPNGIELTYPTKLAQRSAVLKLVSAERTADRWCCAGIDRRRRKPSVIGESCTIQIGSAVINVLVKSVVYIALLSAGVQCLCSKLSRTEGMKLHRDKPFFLSM